MTFQSATTNNVRYGGYLNRRKCRLPMCTRRVYKIKDTICEHHKTRIKWLQKGELKIEVIDYSND